MPRAGRPADERGGARAAVDAARELDQEGVRSFRDGRYVDATAYFRAAYRLGAPSSELWNVARSRERLDDAEGAADVIEEYLRLKDLQPQDRAEAEREVQGLRARPSILTVTTSPASASVLLDGKPASGVTPLSVEVHPGPHSLVVRRDGYFSETKALEARFGRALIVTLDLERLQK